VTIGAGVRDEWVVLVGDQIALPPRTRDQTKPIANPVPVTDGVGKFIRHVRCDAQQANYRLAPEALGSFFTLSEIIVVSCSPAGSVPRVP
jgi:hypothetical protein